MRPRQVAALLHVRGEVEQVERLVRDHQLQIADADGCLPSDMATGSTEEIDEELRLTYVAATRAREFLYMLWPLRYFHRPAMVSDSHSYAQRSRFLTEDVVATMDCSGLQEAQAVRGLQEQIGGHVDIGRRLKGLWE